MSQSFKDFRKKTLSKIAAFLIAHVGQFLLRLTMWTCRIEIEGLNRFIDTAAKHKCIMMLWHNRLALVPYILSTYTPQFIYAAFVSKSRDGELLAAVARSYRAGRVISVPHDARTQALRELIQRLENNKEIMLMTPDGPRGPAYIVKSGVAFAAKMSEAHVVPWTWSADKCWQLKTWDRLMLPKPFSKITVSFGEPVIAKSDDLKENTRLLQESLTNLV